MPTDLKRTRYLEHLNPVSNQQVLFHLGQQLALHHLVHTKLEFGDPTTTDVKYTSRACCRPIQSNVEQALLAQSSLPHCAQHLQMPLPLVQPLQTTALINVVQQLYRNENSVQLRACMDAFQQQLVQALVALPPQQHEHQIGPCHQTLYRFQP